MDSQLPAAHNITAYRGDPFERTFRFKVGTALEVFPDGTTFRAQVRATADAPVLAEFVAALDAPNSEVTVSLTPVQTSALPSSPCVWDLQQVGGPTRLAGTFSIVKDVTR